MFDFEKISFNDASIQDIRIFPSTVEVDYKDWREQPHTLVFESAISCFVLSADGKVLSHGKTEEDVRYLHECCEVVEEGCSGKYRVCNFVDAWYGRTILRICTSRVRKTVNYAEVSPA